MISSKNKFKLHKYFSIQYYKKKEPKAKNINTGIPI